MNYKSILIMLNLFLGFYSLAHASSAPSAPSATSIHDLPAEVHHNIISSLGKKDALKLGSTNKYFHQIVKVNIQCPILTLSLIKKTPPDLAKATTLTANEFINKDIISAYGRKWTIKYLSIGFNETFLEFMVQNNVTHLENLPVANANDLLGQKYIHNPRTECVYDLHDQALSGAILVLGIEE